MSFRLGLDGRERWGLDPYRENKTAKTADDDAKFAAMPIRLFAPGCTHDRTSYSIQTCDACKTYSRRMTIPV